MNPSIKQRLSNSMGTSDLNRTRFILSINFACTRIRNIFIPLIVLLMWHSNIVGQFYNRLPQESAEQFIASCGPHHEKPTGIAEKDEGNCEWIFYHLTQFADTSNIYSAATYTFHGWQSFDHWHYRLAFVDTLGKSNACWAPPFAEAPLWINVDNDPFEEMCLPLYFSPYCDTYTPYLVCIFYDDFCATDNINGAVRLPLLDFRIDQIPLPSREELAALIISTMRKK
jgi:hypothetical protein